MRRYAYKKFYSWSAEIAYLVGLIAADGCLINNLRHINITSKDWEIIQSVQNILDISVKIPTKVSMYGGEAYHLTFSNVALYDFLFACGLTPAKSKTIRALLIPDEYYPDFLRGYFDGDGTVYGYWDKRWRNSLMYYTGFVSASPQFLLWLQETNSRLVRVTSGKVKPQARAATLTYAKSDSQKLFNFMYYATALPKLSRKYAKFVAFLEADPYANKELFARVLESVDRLA